MAWAPDYILLAEVRDYVRVDDSVDDAKLSMAIPAASRSIDRGTGRQFGKVDAPEERTFERVRYNSRTCRWHAQVDDFYTLAGLVMPTAVGTDYKFSPRNALLKGFVYTEVSFGTDPRNDDGELVMTAAWGWPSVPLSIKHAAALQTSRFAARWDSPYGIAGSPDQGSELRLLAKVDPDVFVSIRHYRRDWWAR